MIRPVLKMGEELLLEKAMPVKAFGTPELRRLVVDMWDTMDVEGGIGIAAPQASRFRSSASVRRRARRLRAHAGFREPCSSIPLSNPSAKRR